MKALIIALGAAAVIAGTATADEVWFTDIGEVVYEADLDNGQAVLSYALPDTELRGRIFLPGLAGVYEGRTVYDGFWIEPAFDNGVSVCTVEVRDRQTDSTSDVWGRVKLMFIDADFPGRWVALRGDCFDEPTHMLIGTPKTAEDYETQE